jgi:hypothetical protein
MNDWYNEDEIKDAETQAATEQPTEVPQEQPTEQPTELPSEQPTGEPQVVDPVPAPAATDDTPPPPAPQQEQRQPSPMIPKSRLDEEIEKRRKLEEELKLARTFVEQTLQQRQVQQQQPQQPQQQQPSPEEIVTALYKKEYDALLDGDTEAALNFRRQADNLRTEIIRQQTFMEAQTVVNGNFEQTAFNQRLSQVVEQYPVFLETSADYDPQLAQMALNIGNSFKAQGMNSITALEKTLEMLQPLLQAKYTPAAPIQPQPTVQRSMQTNVQAAAAQPPATHRAGSAPQRSRIDVSTMTIEDFEKLSDKEIEQLYGG